MPALTLGLRNACLPEPTCIELYTEGRSEAAWRNRVVVSCCLYPDVVVIDGWQEIRDWLTGLVFSSTVSRQPAPVYQALDECAAALGLPPPWDPVLLALADYAPELATGVRAELERARRTSGAGIASSIPHPDQDLELLLSGFACCHSRPTSSYMRNVFNHRLAIFREAIERFIRDHGATPEGELEIWHEGKYFCHVDCSELRRAARLGAPSGLRRAFYRRQGLATRARTGEGT